MKYSIIYIYVIKILKKNPSKVWSKLFDFEVWPALLKGSDELQKFDFKEVKNAAKYYCSHNISTAEEKLLTIKH